MTYQDLINELQNLSPEELNQPVHYYIPSPEEYTGDTTLSLEEVDSTIVYIDDLVCLHA